MEENMNLFCLKLLEKLGRFFWQIDENRINKFLDLLLKGCDEDQALNYRSYGLGIFEFDILYNIAKTNANHRADRLDCHNVFYIVYYFHFLELFTKIILKKINRC